MAENNPVPLTGWEGGATNLEFGHFGCDCGAEDMSLCTLCKHCHFCLNNKDRHPQGAAGEEECPWKVEDHGEENGPWGGNDDNNFLCPMKKDGWEDWMSDKNDASNGYRLSPLLSTGPDGHSGVFADPSTEESTWICPDDSESHADDGDDDCNEGDGCAKDDGREKPARRKRKSGSRKIRRKIKRKKRKIGNLTSSQFLGLLYDTCMDEGECYSGQGWKNTYKVFKKFNFLDESLMKFIRSNKKFRTKFMFDGFRFIKSNVDPSVCISGPPPIKRVPLDSFHPSGKS